MIIEFKINNFLSIKDEQILSFEPTSVGGLEEYQLITIPEYNRKVLKMAAIFGANASGKTNILNALDFLRTAILYSSSSDSIYPAHIFRPFAFSEDTQNKPGAFEITFYNYEKIFKFGFEIADGNVIHKEYLEELSLHNRWSILYLRQRIDKDKYSSRGKILSKLYKELINNLDKHTLFITNMKNFNHPILTGIIKYFSNNFMPIITPDHNTVLSNVTTEIFKSIKEKKDETLKYINRADFNINDIKIKEKTINVKELQNTKTSDDIPTRELESKTDKEGNYRFDTIMFGHKVEGSEKEHELNIEDESSGTKRLYELSGPLIHLSGQNGILFVDELESSLHPLLFDFVIKSFLEDSKMSQLIYSTHNTSSLNLDLLRRDEIWFTEKKKDGSTQLYCLSDFKERKDKKLINAYLYGKYGAIPNL